MDCIHELGGQGRVRLLPPPARATNGPAKEGRREQGQQGKEQEDDGRVEIKHRHEDEDEDRRDAGDNQLRQVLPIERLQLLNRVHRIDEHVAGAPFLQVARAEGEQVGVEQAA